MRGEVILARSLDIIRTYDKTASVDQVPLVICQISRWPVHLLNGCDKPGYINCSSESVPSTKISLSGTQEV
jgi:hypothetical protein